MFLGSHREETKRKKSTIKRIIRKKTEPNLPKPRAATLVAIKTFILPFLKSLNASSRWDCLRSPWIDVVGWSDSDKKEAKKSAVRFVSTNTIVPRGSPEFKISISFSRFLNLLTSKTFCLTSLEAPPTWPIAKKMYSCRYLPANRWIESGNVAENISVWRLPAGTIVGLFIISSTAGAKPISSMPVMQIRNLKKMHFVHIVWVNLRSASSSTKYRRFSNVTKVLSQKSFKRPGVATKIWQPFCKIQDIQSKCNETIVFHFWNKENNDICLEHFKLNAYHFYFAMQKNQGLNLEWDENCLF